MISQREKSVYLAVCAGQLALMGLAFGLFYVVNDWLRVSWLAAPQAYAQILTVMLLALAGEMATRPDGLRTGAGRAPRKLAMAIARRQTLWLAAGFGIFLTLTRDTSISRAFLVIFVVLSFPIFFFANRRGRHWLYMVFPSASLKMRL
ncbi:MAG: hypothetical protein ACKOB0_01300, partial [Chthoniobacterales bacterium]